MIYALSAILLFLVFRVVSKMRELRGASFEPMDDPFLVEKPASEMRYPDATPREADRVASPSPDALRSRDDPGHRADPSRHSSDSDTDNGVWVSGL